MEAINELYDITKKIELILKKDQPRQDRQKLIDKVNKLLQQRKAIIDQLPSKLTDEEKQLMADIIKTNTEINILLNGLMDNITNDIKQVRNTKLIHNKYNKSFSGDGMFFDKRK